MKIMGPICIPPWLFSIWSAGLTKPGSKGVHRHDSQIHRCGSHYGDGQWGVYAKCTFAFNKPLMCAATCACTGVCVCARACAHIRAISNLA